MVEVVCCHVVVVMWLKSCVVAGCVVMWLKSRVVAGCVVMWLKSFG